MRRREDYTDFTKDLLLQITRYSKAACGALLCNPMEKQPIQGALTAAAVYGTDGSPDYLTQDEGRRAASELLSVREAFLFIHVLYHTRLKTKHFLLAAHVSVIVQFQLSPQTNQT